MSTHQRIENMSFAAPPLVQQLFRRSLILGVVFALAALIGAFVNPTEFMHAYLLAFMFCLGPTLGSMAMLMVWHLTGGEWGVAIRRTLEAAMGTLPLLAVLFVPIAATLRMNYPWARPEEVAHDEHLHRLATQYLRPSAFVLHAIAYFVAWGFLVYFLNRWSAEQDHPPARVLAPYFRAISAAGILVYGWTLTFATVDWVMSMDPNWTSTIYAMIFMVGQALFAMSLCAVVGRLLVKREPMMAVLQPRHFHDVGNLMLTFTMLWAYLNFSQWLITWSGNLPEEIRWYLPRLHGGWRELGGFLMFGQFALPFALLLSRGLKRDSHRLALLASWIILMRYFDLLWNIEPAFSPGHLHYSWLDLVVPAAMFGLWITYFFWNLQRRPLVAAYDPHFLALVEKQRE